MNRPTYQQDQKITNNLQLVFIHLPKTGGTSLRSTLWQVFGRNAVARIDIPLDDQQVRFNETELKMSSLPTHILAAHGHFNPLHFEKYFAVDKHTKFISWLRDPVDRVISNYYYLEKRLQEELDEPGKNLNILSKMQRTLEEYAKADLNRNRMSRFLSGKDLKELFFVGILEEFEADLRWLSSILDWPVLTIHHHNRSGSENKSVSEEMRQKIASWNAEDVELYRYALEMRSLRT